MATENAVKKPKMVKIRLPLSRNESEDVYVAINGKSYLIKRGVTVEVPESVAEVLEHKEEMLEKSMAYEAQASANANQ
jgi:hypothetical protein